MPASNWQSVRAGTRPLYVPKLTIGAATPCYTCSHPRSSHSMLIIQGACRGAGCGCPFFSPLCGCHHILADHFWSTPPHPLSCSRCVCMKFGASQVEQPKLPF